MPDGRSLPPRGRSDSSRGGSLANEQRLRALGDAVERKNGGTPKGPKKKRSTGKIVAIVAAIVAFAVVAFGAGSYLYGYWEFSKIKKQDCKVCQIESSVPNSPFNVLEVGSDSRAGLSGSWAAATGAGGVSGQRSDVVKIMHVDPKNLSVTIISIPRDTLVTLLANQNLYTNYNRINVNFATGNPDLLVRTIEANFGIPINHVVTVSFAGLIHAANAVGGVYLDFPYPAKDAYSGLNITHPGCQLMRDFRALAVVRSRHYQYYKNGQWWYDGSSDYGRIQRQDAFIKALINKTKQTIGPGSIFGLLQALPQGIELDNTLGYNELIGLALKFRHFNAANLHSYTLPVTSAGYVSPYGDVLVVNQPAAQKMLVSVFGNELKKPTNPPPNANLQPNPPPYIPVPTTTTTVHHTTTSGSGGSKPTTTTSLPPQSEYASYNPYPCTPK